MGFAALFFVRLQRGVLFPCLQLGLFPCLQQGLFPCLLPDGSSLQRPCLQRLPDGASLPADCLPCRSLLPYPLPTLFHGAPGQQLCQGAPASSSSRWLSATVPPSSSPWHSWPAAPLRRPGQQQLCHGAPARNNSVTAPPPATTSRWRSATAPLPATNLIRRRKVFRFG